MAVVWPSKNNFVNGDVLTAANMNNIGDTLNVFNPTSATAGQVWTADGAASGSFQTPSGGMTQLVSQSLTTGTRYTFTGISTAYQNLYLRLANCTISTAAAVGIEVAGSTALYRSGYRQASSLPMSTADAYNTGYLTGANANFLFGIWAFDTTVSFQANMTIHDYARASTKYKLIYSQQVGIDSSTSRQAVSENLGFAAQTAADAAITQIAIYASGATFTGGTFQIFGVK